MSTKIYSSHNSILPDYYVDDKNRVYSWAEYPYGTPEYVIDDKNRIYSWAKYPYGTPEYVIDDKNRIYSWAEYPYGTPEYVIDDKNRIYSWAKYPYGTPEYVSDRSQNRTSDSSDNHGSSVSGGTTGGGGTTGDGGGADGIIGSIFRILSIPLGLLGLVPIYWICHLPGYLGSIDFGTQKIIGIVGCIVFDLIMTLILIASAKGNFEDDMEDRFSAYCGLVFLTVSLTSVLLFDMRLRDGFVRLLWKLLMNRGGVSFFSYLLIPPISLLPLLVYQFKVGDYVYRGEDSWVKIIKNFHNILFWVTFPLSAILTFLRNVESMKDGSLRPFGSFIFFMIIIVAVGIGCYQLKKAALEDAENYPL